jgi:PAS domain S-box-containing protein
LVANVHGFLISNDESFLKNRNQIINNINQSIQQIEKLTQDNPTQQESLIILKQLVKGRIDFSDLLIKTRKTKGENAANDLFSTLRGEQIVDRISALIQKMIDEENRLLEIRNQLVIENASNTTKINYLGIIMQLTLLVLFFLFVTKDISGKRKAQKELLALNEDLEEIVEDRTELLKQSNQKIIQERDKANQYLDIAGVMLLLLNSSGKVAKINKKGCEVLGYSENEIVGKDWFETFLPQNLSDDVRNVFEEIMKGKIKLSESYENTIINKNGEERHIAWNNVLLYDDEGKPTGTLSSGEDITERKLSEDKIRNINAELEQKIEERTKLLAATNENLHQEMLEHQKTEERFRLVVESAPNAIILVDANGFIQLVNTQTENYFGYQRAELIGQKIEILVPDATKIGHENMHTNFIHQASEHQMGVGRDLFGLKKDGTKFPIEVGLNPILIQNEMLILTSIIDITERRKNEIELIKFKAALDSSADDIFIIDYEKNVFIDANNTALKSLGYTKEELLQMAPNDIKPLISKDELKKIFDKIIHSQSKLDKIETVHRRKNGTDFEVEVFIRAFRFDNSDLLIASVREITERKIAEEAIKNAKTEAERANIAKSEFLSRMSHELRTPLNSILGFTQLMSMGELNLAHQKGVDHIMKSGKHLLNLINEVLDLSRIEAGELSISLEPVQLNSIILETLDVIYPMAQEKSIKIEFKNQKMDNFFVKSDHQKLKQVLLNLVNNAVKFNKDSGLVTIKAEKYKNEKIRISIIDTGKGIAPEEIPKLFNPFQRIGSEISVIEGTGLGLAVSKKLMEAMHGSIGVESEIDKGSTFWIEFSQAECQNGHQERMGSFITNESDDITISGTLLYIEDNISNQQLVKQIMDTQRPSVNLITNMYGKNTLKLAVEYKPNIILLDLDLPDIHGSKVLELLQKNNETKDIPVIVLSADAMEKQIEKLLKAGASAYLTKPIDVLELLREVDKCLKFKV